MTDNYEFMKSTEPQGVDLETPYVSKNYSYISDINQGVYSNGLTLVQFDCSSIYNSSGFIGTSDMFVTIPLTYIQAFTSNVATGALVAPTADGKNWARLGLKAGYWNLLQSADLQVNGKTVEQYQPNLSVYTGIKLLSQMSQDDLASFGPSLGLGSVLDTPGAMKFNNFASAQGAGVYPAGTGPLGGNGLVNNSPFANTAAPTVSNGGDQGVLGIQNVGAYNKGLFDRLNRCVDTTSILGMSNLYGAAANGGGSFMGINQLNAEFKPTFRITNEYMIWNDIGIIRLKDIFDSMKNLPLMKRFDGILRLYVNCGVIGVGSVGGVIGAVPGSMVASASSSTFTNGCPLIIPSLSAGTTATTTGIVSGLFISKVTQTSTFGVNLGLSGAAHPMPSCRIYYPMIVMKPEKAISYVSENRAKRVCYTTILSNQLSTILEGGQFSALIQSGVSKIKGVMMVPYLSASTCGKLDVTTLISGIVPFSPLLSPFIDTAQNGPISLTNLQVSIGGQNILQNNNLSYTFESFLEQFSVYEKLASSDLGLSCGLISQYAWEQGSPRVYYIDCARGNISDSLTPRNVTLSFTNNSLQTIDVLVFVEYFQELEINVESGLIKM
jgi:hypothetical protein